MAETAVLLPYYRREEPLLQTLKSFHGETEPFDLIIVDDGSPVPLVLNPSHFPFPVHVIRQEPNGGITRALNRGLEYILSKDYQFVARIDAGDRWVPGRIAAQRNFLKDNPDHVLVGSCMRYVHSDGSFAYDWDMPLTDEAVQNFMHFNSAVFHPAAMMRADVVRRAGFYSEDFPAAEDYEFFRRLMTYGKAANLPGRWLDYEVGMPGTSISVDNHTQQIKSVIKAQLRYFNFLNWRAYAGVAYKMMHLYLPGVAAMAKKNFRAR